MENIKVSKVLKVGNSLAVVIPAAILKGLKIERGDQVVFGVYDENVFCVRRLSPAELKDMKPKDFTF